MSEELIKEYGNILANKSFSIAYLYNRILEVEENSWEKDGGKKTRTGDKIPLEELMVYSEAFFFECKSFLDIFIKYLCGKDFREKIYFNKDTLQKITPQDEFVQNLIKYWDEGTNGKFFFSLKQLNEYRIAIAHGTILNLGKKMLFFEQGKGGSFYTLADNPNDYFKDYTYSNHIGLFPFLEEIQKIMDNILNVLREKKKELFGIYTLS